MTSGCLREIGMHGTNLNLAIFLYQPVGRAQEDFSRNVYWTIAKRAPRPFIGCEEVTGLCGIPGAELHQRQAANLGMYLGGIGTENLQFCPVGIVLAQAANLLVELGAALVIKILRRQPLLRSGQADSYILREVAMMGFAVHLMNL